MPLYGLAHRLLAVIGRDLSCGGVEIIVVSPEFAAEVKRLEDPRLIRGRGRFLDDLRPSGTLVLGVVRSPHAHARIRAISTPTEAQGVVAVLTAADLGPANRPLPMMVPSPPPLNPMTQRALAVEKVRYVGEAVAAVLAEDRFSAEDAIEGVVVEYEPITAVTDPRGALDPDAVLLHDECASNEVGSWTIRTGDPEAAFAAADLVVAATLEIARCAAHPIETRGVLAVPDPTEDRLTLWTSTQVPHAILLALSEVLGRREESIRVISPDVGGAFGSKLCLYPEEVLCAVLALRTGRPVKWVETRREHCLATAHGRGQVHSAQIAVKKDGTILGLRDRFWHDNGAYAPYGLRLPLVTLASLVGPYHIANVEAAFTAVFTNKAPVIPYRGAGQPEAVFVLERMVDRAARILGIDPVEMRRQNLIPARAFPHDTGLGYPGMGTVVYDDGSCPAALDLLLQQVDLPAFHALQAAERDQGRLLGLGVACYQEATGAGTYEGATVSVDGLGEVQVACGLASQGQGHETVLAQVAAQVLDVSVERVTVRTSDTATIPYGVGTWGSRGAAVGAAAVAGAAEEVKEKAARVAARVLEARPEDIRWEDGNAFVTGLPDRRVALAHLARAAASGRGSLMLAEGPGLRATHYFSPKALTYASGAHAAVVQVDLETRSVRVVRYVVAHDCGRMLHPPIVKGQIVGGVVQGIGAALGEQVVYDEWGQLLSGALTEYPLPRASGVPTIEVVHLETPSRLNPLGARGAGEGGIIPVAPAIVAAIENALAPLDVTIDAVPVTPQVLDAILRTLPRSTAPQPEAQSGASRQARRIE